MVSLETTEHIKPWIIIHISPVWISTFFVVQCLHSTNSMVYWRDWLIWWGQCNGLSSSIPLIYVEFGFCSTGFWRWQAALIMKSRILRIQLISSIFFILKISLNYLCHQYRFECFQFSLGNEFNKIKLFCLYIFMFFDSHTDIFFPTINYIYLHW